MELITASRNPAKRFVFALDLNASVETLRLPTRARHCLAAAQVGTVGELLCMSEAELLRLPHFGQVSLDSVKGALAGAGFRLLGKPRPP